MELETFRRIRGNVHGTVDVTALEDQVIDHPIFQRLRRVKQLAFLSLVFPGASHTRFEHSLGVLQMTGETWHKMRANQKRLANSCSLYRHFAATEKRGSGPTPLVHGLLAPTFAVMDEIFSCGYTQQALRLAGLLHDIGHPPFSHSGERFLPTWKQILVAQRGHAPSYITEYLEESCLKIAASGRDPGKVRVRHEIYTILLVERLIADVNQTYKGPFQISARDIISIMTPDIEPEPGSPLIKHGVYRLCHELISGEVDTDRMDYLLRDSRECGVVYGIFDATRIQDSLSLYFDERDQGVHLAITLSGLAAFEDYLRARHSMYLQLYFHKTSVAAESMIQHLAKLLGDWTMPADALAYAELDEYNIEAALLAEAAKLAPSDYARCQSVLQDLLRRRRLWKRVFEVSSKDRASGEIATASACDLLRSIGLNFEQVSSENSLTSFRTRRDDEHSLNYLRLIRKDQDQFPRVVPIEDYASPALIQGDTRVHISRIYVEDKVGADGQRQPDTAKQAIRNRSN